MYTRQMGAQNKKKVQLKLLYSEKKFFVFKHIHSYHL